MLTRTDSGNGSKLNFSCLVIPNFLKLTADLLAMARTRSSSMMAGVWQQKKTNAPLS